MASALRSGATLPPIGPAPDCNVVQLICSAAEHVELNLAIVVRRHPFIATGRQPLHQPATRYSDQLPLHRTPLLQRHCA